MTRGSIWEIAVITSPDAEEGVSGLMTEVMGKPASAYLDTGKQTARISLFLENRADWTPARKAMLLAGLDALRRAASSRGAGLSPPTRLSVKRLPREDWAESWKKHFPCLEIGSRLLIKPGWIRSKPAKNQAVVVLDPGLSFGTGHHPTTTFCLKELVRQSRSQRPQALLDIGTGSGILAIAAAKLGFRPVDAMDFDPESVKIARRNARTNGVQHRVKIVAGDLRALPRQSQKKYDLICANLISDILVGEQERILNRLQTGGKLVLAGILKREFGQVRAAYERVGLTLDRKRTEREWQSGTFIKGKGFSKISQAILRAGAS